MDELMQKRMAFKKDLLRLLDAVNTGQPISEISALGTRLIKTAESLDVKGVDVLQLDPHELIASIESKTIVLEALENKIKYVRSKMDATT